jgi:molybdate transport system substrate-binding protein
MGPLIGKHQLLATGLGFGFSLAGPIMRPFQVALVLIPLLLPTLAYARDIRVLTPGVVANAGIRDIAAAYGKQTGINVMIVTDGMAKIVGDIETGKPPADVIVLPVDVMDSFGTTGGVRKGSVAMIGRVEIGLAMRAGAPHPDISTIQKLRTVLFAADSVLYSDPASGSMEAGIIDALLKRPDFAGVRGKISTKGEGGEALVRGEGQMALQLICEILNHPEIELVAPLPPELGAHIDSAVAVSARSADSDAAAAFVRYMLAPGQTAVWKAKGLNRMN